MECDAWIANDANKGFRDEGREWAYWLHASAGIEYTTMRLLGRNSLSISY